MVEDESRKKEDESMVQDKSMEKKKGKKNESMVLQERRRVNDMFWRATCHWYSLRCNTLQHTATHCNTLQHTATHCNTLQHTAIHCNTLQHTATHICFDARLVTDTTFANKSRRPACVCGSRCTYTLQHNAIHCNTLQHTATHCNTLQHTARERERECMHEGKQHHCICQPDFQPMFFKWLEYVCIIVQPVHVFRLYYDIHLSLPQTSRANPVQCCSTHLEKNVHHSTAYCIESVMQSSSPISISLVSFQQNMAKET